MRPSRTPTPRLTAGRTGPASAPAPAWGDSEVSVEGRPVQGQQHSAMAQHTFRAPVSPVVTAAATVSLVTCVCVVVAAVWVDATTCRRVFNTSNGCVTMAAITPTRQRMRYKQVSERKHNEVRRSEMK
jgi:hypothetical protein